MIEKLKQKIQKLKEAMYYSETILGKLYQAWTVWSYSREMRKELEKSELEREELERWYQSYFEEQEQFERELELELIERDQLLYEEWFEEDQRRRDEDERHERYMNGTCSKCGEYRFGCRCY